MVNKTRKLIKNGIILGLFLSPFVLIVLPKDYFDKGATLCFSKRFFDFECLGCGMTRATQHLLHLDFKIAWEYNKLIVFVFPLLFYFWLKQIIVYIRWIKTKK